MKTFVDRDFEYHKTLTQLWLQIALTLTDQPLLPFNCSQYASRLTYYAKDVQTKYDKILNQHNIVLGKWPIWTRSFFANFDISDRDMSERQISPEPTENNLILFFSLR